MQLIDPPRVVGALAATVSTSPTGEVGAVVAAKTLSDVERSDMIVLDALVGSFSDFDGFCSALFDRVDELAGTVRPSHRAAIVMVEPDLFPRVERHMLIDLSAFPAALGQFKPPVNASVIARPYPPHAEQDPARRAVTLAAAGDIVAISPAMARKVMQHPYDALASARFDPAVSNPLADALGRCFDVVMVDNAERNRARHRRGEL